jgi:hypothetical protein
VSGVLLVGFDGPPTGLLFSIDGRGIQDNALTIGRPLSSNLQTTKSGRKLLTIEATIGTGTGVREDQLSVFQLDRDRIHKLWSGIAYRYDAIDPKTSSVKRGTVALTESEDGKWLILDHVLIEESKGRRDHSPHVKHLRQTLPFAD